MNDISFDPMKFTISTGEGVPAGTYTAKFSRAEYLPEQDPDPMSGKGGRQFAAIRFVWEISEGENAGKTASTDTPKSFGAKSRFYQVACWLLGRQPNPGENVDLSPCIGKKISAYVGFPTREDVDRSH